ncbi:MAG TPA: Gfo/Idh/MocA family oxidoreductase [Dehalococcoidia bacterium]|nr:Gfo/Idh/MocA family oxidoreductase [Dehalococcoidia bacterium]
MTVRVALIGCGFVGRFHSAGIRAVVRRELLDVEYAVVCDEHEDRARSFADLTGAEPTTDVAAVLDAPDIDVIYVCVPTAYHKDLVLRAAANGKHVFCEKPLATNLADVEEMVAAVEAAGVKAGVGLVLRHSPILNVLKDLMDDPTLGRLMTIVFRDDQFFPITGQYMSDWRKDRSIVGAGTLLEHSIHDVDILNWFGGQVTGVHGIVRNFAGHEGVEDLVVSTIDFSNEAEASLTSIWHSIMGRPSTRHLEVFFEKGLFIVDHDYSGPIEIQVHALNPQTVSEDEVRERYLAKVGLQGPEFEGLLRYSLEDYFFLRAVAENREPFPNFGTALKAHRVVDAIYRSGAAGGELISL